MPNQLPVTIDFGTIPQTGLGYTPQQFADRLGTNGRIFTEQQFALFVTGATAPTSDVGPWAANGNEWRYWDSNVGAYVPFIIPSESLGYYVGNSTPDPNVYTFWIQLDGSGSPLALKTYYSGSWVDVYATTLGTYLTVAAAAATYQTIAGMASYLTIADAAATYLTIAAAAAGYQPLNSNLTTITTSTLGDIIYASGTNTLAKLAGNTTATKKFLTQTGNGSASAAPGWNTIVAGDIPDISATYATKASPALTGTPTAPTAAPGTNTTQLATTAFVTAAVAAIPPPTSFTSAPARAVLAGTQTVAIDTAPHKLLFASEVFDPNNAYDAANSRYLAPATGYYQVFIELQVDNSGGVAASMELELSVYVNGVANQTAGMAIASPPGGRWYPSLSAIVPASAGQAIEVYLTASDGTNSANIDVGVQSTFAVNRIPQS